MAIKSKFKSVEKLHKAFCDILSEMSSKTNAITMLTQERDEQQAEFESTIKGFGFLVVKSDEKE